MKPVFQSPHFSIQRRDNGVPTIGYSRSPTHKMSHFDLPHKQNSEISYHPQSYNEGGSKKIYSSIKALGDKI